MSASPMNWIAALGLVTSLALAAPSFAQEGGEEEQLPQLSTHVMPDGQEHGVFAAEAFTAASGVPVFAIEVYYPYEDQSDTAMVEYADHLMEIQLKDLAADFRTTTVQIWLHDLADDGETMGAELADIQYMFDGAGQWTRVTQEDLPVQPSTFYPQPEEEEFALPSGVTVYIEPVLTLYPGTEAPYPRVTAVIPEIAEDYSDATSIAAELWDLALRNHAFLVDETEVSFRVVREHYQNRHYMRYGLKEYFARQEAGTPWPDLRTLITANRAAEEAAAAEAAEATEAAEAE